MDYGYFYDTNLHLNDAGVIARTNQLLLDLTRELCIIDRVTVEVPPPPGLESEDVALGDIPSLIILYMSPACWAIAS